MPTPKLKWHVTDKRDPKYRYEKILTWARLRYTDHGYLIVSKGNQKTRFTIIENMAATKLLGCKIH